MSLYSIAINERNCYCIAIAYSLAIILIIERELDISDNEHNTILTELGIENPNLLNPAKQRSREEWLRLQSYPERLAETPYIWRRRTARGSKNARGKFITPRESLK